MVVHVGQLHLFLNPDGDRFMKKVLLISLLLATSTAFAAPEKQSPVDDKYSAAHGFVSTKTRAEVQGEAAKKKTLYGWFPVDYGWKGQKSEKQVEAELISYKVDRAEVARIEAVYFGD
jgi:hypothetical protein